ncbi:MAG TPA: asparagine synthase (glutamine-hydrolyzing) [Vicinamibacterales bacterium]
MCGIAGFFDLSGAPADPVTLARMTGVQRHRGPDDQGFRLFSLRSGASEELQPGDLAPRSQFEGALGFNRLKILDLSQCGHQPMTNRDGSIVLAFNGEIYNAFDFRPELEASGFQFRSRTDTEVILYLYEKYGLDGMLERLNGMFAIVLADLRSREIHIARDHFGIKPLYWTMAGSTILFASEAKSFLSHPAFRAELDDGAIDEYLSFRFIAGEQSLLKGVRHVRPGHCLRITPTGVTSRAFWRLPDHERRDLTDGAALEALEGVLRDSVKSQLLSDVKVGCQLSGGIDSSVVSLFARSHFDANMETFSIVFDDPNYTEKAWMEQAAAAARAVSHQFTFTSDFFFDTISQASWHMDQPMGHPNSVGIWLLAQRAKEFVTVLLSGEGADEVFGGYTRFYYASLQSKVSPWMPLLRATPGVGHRFARQFRDSPADSFIMASLFEQPEDLAAMRPDANFGGVLERRRTLFNEGQADHLSNCFRYEMQTYLVDLLIRQDKMTMAHSVENRVPFLDRKLVDFTRSIASRHLVRDSVSLRDSRMRNTKVVLKQLAAKHFGDRFAYRAKSGFSLPLADLFAGPRAARLMEDGILPAVRDRGIVDAEVIRGRWKRMRQLGQGASESVWISVALELWAQQFLDGRAPRPAADVMPVVLEAPSPAAAPPAARNGHGRNLRVVFCWAEVTGYMASCWQALARRPGIDLHILHTRQLFQRQNPFNLGPLLDGISNREFSKDQPNIDEWLLREVADRRPDVVVVCGWIFWPYTRLMAHPSLAHARIIIGMDSPWRGTAVQRLSRWRLRNIVQHSDMFVTAGERSAEYARHMGVPIERIRSGYYGFDYDRFSPIVDRRSRRAGGWPRQFLFVGRYVPQKDLPTLVKAYAEYRAGVSDPWGLTCCGSGPEGAHLKGQPGVTDAGFTQPDDQPGIFENHGAFILASNFEPWGVVLAEAAASGLPLLCTSACGAGADLVRHAVNGFITGPGDAHALAAKMRWIHDHEEQLAEMGRRGRELSANFSAEQWAARWHNYMTDLTGPAD